MHERRIAAFLPDGDGETVPSNVEGMPYPIHPLQLTAMGMLVSDSLQLEELHKACDGGAALGVHGRRPAAPPAGRHGLAVESDRHLLIIASQGGRPWNAVLPARSPGHRCDPGHRTGDCRPARLGRRAGRRQPQARCRRRGDTGHGQGEPAAKPSTSPPTCAIPTQVKAMVAEVAKRGGRLDYVVSNAGINPFMTWDDTPIEEFDKLFETNVRGSLGRLHRRRAPDGRGGPWRRHRHDQLDLRPCRRADPGRLLRHQGRHQHAGQGAGRGARQTRHPRQRDRAGRHRDPHERPGCSNCPMS